MECEERDRLRRAYNKAVAEVFRASNTLAELAGRSLLEDYNVLLRERDRARARGSQARSAYQEHIGRHACEAEEDLPGPR